MHLFDHFKEKKEVEEEQGVGRAEKNTLQARRTNAQH